MKRVTQNPLPVVEMMLDTCRKDFVDFFFTQDERGRSLCVYPTSDDAFAAEHAVHIADGADPIVQAGVIGLVYSHNLQFEKQTSAAAAAFIRTCVADFHFGPSPEDGS